MLVPSMYCTSQTLYTNITFIESPSPFILTKFMEKGLKFMTRRTKLFHLRWCLMRGNYLRKCLMLCMKRSNRLEEAHTSMLLCCKISVQSCILIMYSSSTYKYTMIDVRSTAIDARSTTIDEQQHLLLFLLNNI